MSCWRYDLQSEFVPYLEGELSPRRVTRLERHLVGCESCRAMMTRLRSGLKSARQLQPLKPGGTHRPQEWQTLMADLDGHDAGGHGLARLWESWLDALTTPRAVQLLTALVLVLLALLVVTNRSVLFGERSDPPVRLSAMDFIDFHHLRIPDFKTNTKPHIATEGYVRDVYADEEEGTLHFKLVEGRQGSEPFVVCEIINPYEMTAPREGSRVRVYGVSRFDAQNDRKWHEVNPVLNIDILKD